MTCVRQESANEDNERYRNTVKDRHLPNTISQKWEKPHTAGLHDAAISHIKIRITFLPGHNSLIKN